MILTDKVRKFFHSISTCKRSDRWTHINEYHVYILNGEQREALYNLNPPPGCFRNLQERNIQIDDETGETEEYSRLVIDLDLEQSDENAPFDVIRRVGELLHDRLRDTLYVAVLQKGIRYHIHFLNLLLYNCLDLKNELKRICPKEYAIDAKAGESHFLMYGAVKLGCDTGQFYKVHKLVVFDKTKQMVVMDSSDANESPRWTYDVNNWFRILSLQRPLDTLDQIATYCEQQSTVASVDATRRRKRSSAGAVKTNKSNKKRRDDAAATERGPDVGDNKLCLSYKYSVKRLQARLLEDLVLMLDEEYAVDYNLWVKTGFVIANLFPDSMGFDLFVAHSKRCSEKFDYHEVEDKWKHIVESSSRGVHRAYPHHLISPPDKKVAALGHQLIYTREDVSTQLQLIAKYIVQTNFFIQTDHPQYPGVKLLYLYDDDEGHYRVCERVNMQKWLIGVREAIFLVQIVRFAEGVVIERLERISAALKCLLNTRVDELWEYMLSSAPYRSTTWSSHPTAQTPLDQRLYMAFPNRQVFDFHAAKFRRWSPKYFVRSINKCDPFDTDEELHRVAIRLFTDWFPDEEMRSWMVDWMLTLLVPGNNIDRGIYILYGPRGNGKSLFLRLLAHLFDAPSLSIILQGEVLQRGSMKSPISAQ